MRKTYAVPARYSTQFMYQDQLNKFWNLIEDKYDEDWRVDSNGDLILEVDDNMLERILQDNYAPAWYNFGAYGGGMKPGPKFERYMLNRPEHLKGLYIIKGIYTPHLMFVPVGQQKREYFFVQEGY